MSAPDSTAADRPAATPRRSRAQAAALLDAFDHGPDRPSQRRFARQQAVPRSTQCFWHENLHPSR